MSGERYKQYILVLDPADKDEKRLIDFMESKHTKKRKNSYSSILMTALNLLLVAQETTKDGKDETD
jgi:accessory gene regulator protein AgrB